MTHSVVRTILGVLSFATLVLSGSAYAQGSKFEWVIGSEASALAVNSAKITLTGNGTFILGQPEKVTGGGTWQVVASNGTTITGHGTYMVTDLVRFELAPGAVSDPTIHAGLAQLRVKFSDGNGGILTVSCHLPGSSARIAEGISASKESVDYFNIVADVAFFKSLD